LFIQLTIVPDTINIERIFENTRKYHLLTGDAIIISTCQEQRIEGIATFDSDFSRVPSIRIIPDRGYRDRGI